MREQVFDLEKKKWICEMKRIELARFPYPELNSDSWERQHQSMPITQEIDQINNQLTVIKENNINQRLSSVLNDMNTSFELLKELNVECGSLIIIINNY